jgi:hypothetical protein
VLTRVLRLRTAPALEVASSADTCSMSLHGPWAVEIKEVIATKACREARVFPRHARALLRHLQDMWADGIIMAYKSCGQAL